VKSQLRSSGDSALVIKLWLPLVATVGALGVFGSDFLTWRFLPAIPLLCLSVFLASLAIVEVRGGILRYRLLFKWKELRSEDLVKAKSIWPPFIGSIQLRKPVLPWGRLYFVLDRNTESNPFRRGEFPLISFINKDNRTSSDVSPSLLSGSSSARLVAATALGILSCVVLLYLIPGEYLKSGQLVSTTQMPTVLKIQFQLVKWLRSLPVQLVGLAFTTYVALLRRKTVDAWLYGFMSGFALAAIAIRRWF
jgi:hypothetical protein